MQKCDKNPNLKHKEKWDFVREKHLRLCCLKMVNDGSSVTLIEKESCNELGLKGDHSPNCLKWTSNTERFEHNSETLSCKISSVYNNKTYILHRIHTVDHLNLPVQTIEMNSIIVMTIFKNQLLHKTAFNQNC